MSAPTDSRTPPHAPPPPAEGDGVPTIVGKSVRNPVTEALALAAGSTLGHYEIIAPLGAGGMASVLKARDTHLGRLVALKILPPEAARDPDSVARFKQEARAAARLDHANVARVFFSGEDRGLHFIAFEFVEGETLRARIEHLGRLPVADAVRFLLHCAAGLQHLAERGVVHRDIKPGNVVIGDDGRAKLIDLGLARHTESVSVNGGVTQSGVTLGTFDYISPEQARDPRTADVRSDIYSLGCTIYHALTGRPPVPEGTAAVKLSAQQLTAPTDPRELNPEVPDALAMVLNRMLAKDPARRYPTAADLTAELSDVARQLGVPVDRAGGESAPATSSATHTRLVPAPPRFPVGWVVAGVVCLAAGLVVASLAGGRAPTGMVVPWDDPPPAAKPPSPFDGGKDEPQRKPVPAGPKLVTTADALIEAARAEVAQITLQPGAVYDLTDTPGLFFNGKRLTLECQDPRNPAVVRLAVSPLGDVPAARAGGFTVGKAESVTLRGIRFELAEKATPAEDEGEVVGVAIHETGKVDVLESVWEEAEAKDGKARSTDVAALHIGRSGGPKPTEFAARHSFFGIKRWTAIEFAGPVTGTLRECGFSTGRVGLRLSVDPDAPVTDPSSALDLRHCTFLLDHRAAAVSAGSVKAAVTVGYSVFAAPSVPDPSAMMMTEADRKPVALRGASDLVTLASVSGEPNAYFRTEMPSGTAGPEWVELAAPPWKTVPPTAEKTEPWKALELNPAVQGVRASRQSGTRILLGATKVPTAAGRLYADSPPGSSSANAPKPGVKVWHPNATPAEKAQFPKGVFDDLQKALDAPGDVLQVRGSGVLKVPTVVLSKPGRVRIQAEDGSVPVLVPADGPLFRVEDGELRLERLHVRLTLPEDSAGKSVTAVVMAGGKRCEWVECTVTADETVSDTSAVVLVHPTGGRPEARFDRCLVRGTGRLVHLPTGVPAALAVTNSVIALKGAVLDLGPPDAPPAEGAVVRVMLSRATVFLAAPLVSAALADIPDAPFVPVQVDADGSLFASFDKFTGPILRVANGDPTSLAKQLPWTSVAANRYANFPAGANFLEVPPKKLGSADWLAFIKEKKPALASVTFANPPTAASDLATVIAADLAVTDGLTADEFGARVGLPVPPEWPKK